MSIRTAPLRKATAAERQDAARIAGVKGRSAQPIAIEWRFNALQHESLTPAQRKRATKKINHLRARTGQTGGRS